MRAIGTFLIVLCLSGLPAMGASFHVVPHPGPNDIPSLQAALDLAQLGDEILLAAGSYSGEFTIDKSVQIRGEPGVEVIPAGYSKVAFTITGGKVTITGVTVKGEGTGIKITGNADLTIEHCQFSGLDVGADLKDGRGKIVDSEFHSCATAITADVRLEVNGCSFSGNAVGIDGYYGAVVLLRDSTFMKNGEAIIGEPPCRVDGNGNRFSENGLDLAGAVSPEVRPHEEGAQMTVEYPSTAYPSLQAAVDAVQTGGKLVVTGPFSESAVIDRSISILPLRSSSQAIFGHPADGKLLPVFSLIGDVQVEMQDFEIHGGIVLGPEAKLSLTDVSISGGSLELTGDSELFWNSGSGELHVTREAVATIEDLTLTGEPGLQVKDLGTVNATHCIVSSPTLQTALTVGGSASLTLAGSFVVGRLTLTDRAQVRIEDSSLGGLARSNKDRPLFAIELAGPVDLALDNVDIGRAWVGLYFAADARLSLAGVKIHDTHVGIGIENRVSEFDFPFGLWTPKVIPHVVIKGTGLTLSNNEVDFAPAATQEPWPIGFYERVYKDRKQDPATAQALDRIARAAKTIKSYHLRVRDNYSWREEIEEIYYVPPDKLRIDTYQSDKLVETILSNGHTLWDYRSFDKSVAKLDIDSLRDDHPNDWKGIWREHTRFDPTFADLYLPSVAYLGTEQIDGEMTYVFSGIPIRGAISDAVSMKVWISPQDRIWRKIEYYTTTGKAFLTKTVLAAETDVAIPDGTFELQVPEGTKINNKSG